MISIITPHFNDFEGLKHLYTCLKAQNADSWEWLIVDDLSDDATRDLMHLFFNGISNPQIQLIFNATKTNASVCRNIGIEHASHERLVFLDSDDGISNDFVSNRQLEVDEFVVFKNYTIVNERGERYPSSPITLDPLDCFLNANFIWQTTCVLWNKAFLKHIGTFDPNLERLQDVELSIRALFASKSYQIIDTKVDFFYNTKPIRLKTDIVRKSCTSVNYLILKIHRDHSLDFNRKSLIKAYYFACARCLPRTTNAEDVFYLKESIKLFHQIKYISTLDYSLGLSLLIFYQYRMISDDLFLKFNRTIFK